MDKMEFINTLTEMYPSSFTEQNLQIWVDLYTRKLPKNIDYDKLFDDMIATADKSIVPSLSSLLNLVAKQKERIAQIEQSNKALKKMEQWRREREEIEKEDKPVTGEILSPLEVLKQSYGEFSWENKNTFTKEEMQTLNRYANKFIPTERLRINFWRQVCRLIVGSRLSKVCICKDFVQ